MRRTIVPWIHIQRSLGESKRAVFSWRIAGVTNFESGRRIALEIGLDQIFGRRIARIDMKAVTDFQGLQQSEIPCHARPDRTKRRPWAQRDPYPMEFAQQREKRRRHRSRSSRSDAPIAATAATRDRLCTNAVRRFKGSPVDPIAATRLGSSPRANLRRFSPARKRFATPTIRA